jgi:hypothetical protein
MDIPPVGKLDLVKPALNALGKDISNENVSGEKNPQSPVPFAGETIGSLSPAIKVLGPNPSRKPQQQD